MTTMASTSTPTKARLPTTGVVVWEWFNEFGKWRPYSPEVAAYIDREGQISTQVCLGTVSASLKMYTIDIPSMCQIRKGTGTSRPVRRVIYPSQSPPAQQMIWEYEGDTPGQWVAYDMEISSCLEQAQQGGQQMLDMETLFQLPYSIHFTTMQQVRMNTGRARKIRRSHLPTPYPSAAKSARCFNKLTTVLADITLPSSSGAGQQSTSCHKAKVTATITSQAAGTSGGDVQASVKMGRPLSTSDSDEDSDAAGVTTPRVKTRQYKRLKKSQSNSHNHCVAAGKKSGVNGVPLGLTQIPGDGQSTASASHSGSSSVPSAAGSYTQLSLTVSGTNPMPSPTYSMPTVSLASMGPAMPLSLVTYAQPLGANLTHGFPPMTHIPPSQQPALTPPHPLHAYGTAAHQTQALSQSHGHTHIPSSQSHGNTHIPSSQSHGNTHIPSSQSHGHTHVPSSQSHGHSHMHGHGHIPSSQSHNHIPSHSHIPSSQSHSHSHIPSSQSHSHSHISSSQSHSHSHIPSSQSHSHSHMPSAHSHSQSHVPSSQPQSHAHMNHNPQATPHSSSSWLGTQICSSPTASSMRKAVSSMSMMGTSQPGPSVSLLPVSQSQPGSGSSYQGPLTRNRLQKQQIVGHGIGGGMLGGAASVNLSGLNGIHQRIGHASQSFSSLAQGTAGTSSSQMQHHAQHPGHDPLHMQLQHVQQQQQQQQHMQPPPQQMPRLGSGSSYPFNMSSFVPTVGLNIIPQSGGLLLPNSGTVQHHAHSASSSARSGRSQAAGPTTETLPTATKIVLPRQKKSKQKPKTGEEVLNKYMEQISPQENEDCCICCEELTKPSSFGEGLPGQLDVIQLNKCSHMFHRACLLAMYDSTHNGDSLQCPTCKTIYGELMGNCPPGEMSYDILSRPLPGYPHCGTIRVSYYISPGVQGPEHPHPGQRFTARGFPRCGFLPDDNRGRKILKLLMIAFRRKLMFAIGTSATTGESDTVTWNEIHHKTEFGSNISGHGYPDPKYLDNVTAELALKGVMEQDL